MAATEARMSGGTGDAETLTENERGALLHHIGAWKWERQGLAAAEADFFAAVEAVLSARLAVERVRGRTAEERARRALLDRIENLEARLAVERVRGAAEAVQAEKRRAAELGGRYFDVLDEEIAASIRSDREYVAHHDAGVLEDAAMDAEARGSGVREDTADWLRDRAAALRAVLPPERSES